MQRRAQPSHQRADDRQVRRYVLSEAWMVFTASRDAGWTRPGQGSRATTSGGSCARECARSRQNAPSPRHPEAAAAAAPRGGGEQRAPLRTPHGRDTPHRQELRAPNLLRPGARSLAHEPRNSRIWAPDRVRRYRGYHGRAHARPRVEPSSGVLTPAIERHRQLTHRRDGLLRARPARPLPAVAGGAGPGGRGEGAGREQPRRGRD